MCEVCDQIETINAVMDAEWKAEVVRSVYLFMFRLDTGRILERLERQQARIQCALIDIQEKIDRDTGKFNLF